METHVKKIIATLLALAALLPAPLPAAEAGAVTLRQCYDWARERSEDLKARAEEIAQSRARARAALGSALPDAAWELNSTYQDPSGVDELERQGFGGFVEKSQIESKFTVRQPLFSGLREFSARSGFQRQARRDELRLERSARELHGRTALAFYAVIAQENERDNTRAALDLSEDRVKELKEFKRLGKARDSEVFTAQAHAAALRAALQQTAARIMSAREDLSFLTGQDLSSRPLADDVPQPRAPSLDGARAAARERADLRALREEVAARRQAVRFAKGGRWPTADVTGNYYTRRATFLEEISWDVVLALRVPLFQGGTVAAEVKESMAALRQAELALEEADRRVRHEVRRLHGELAAAVRETEALEEAAAAAQKSYAALKEEYGLGLVTNLEVLQAQDLLQAQRSARDQARVRAKVLAVQLSVASGEEMP